jgi:hypothetical protein
MCSNVLRSGDKLVILLVKLVNVDAKLVILIAKLVKFHTNLVNLNKSSPTYAAKWIYTTFFPPLSN